MGAGCILHRNCISRPTKVDALGGLIFVHYPKVGDVEKQIFPDVPAICFVIRCIFGKEAGSRLPD